MVSSEAIVVAIVDNEELKFPGAVFSRAGIIEEISWCGWSWSS
jgi:hypothetical protein